MNTASSRFPLLLQTAIEGGSAVASAAGGHAFWLDLLDSGRDDVAGVLASFSESPENVEAVAQLIGQSIAYGAWGRGG